MREVIVNGRFLTQRLTGVQRHAAEMSVALKLLRSDIRIVAPSSIVSRDLARRLEVETIGRRSGHIWEQIDLARHLHEKPGAILINLANTAPLYVPRQIVTIHDLAFLANPSWYSIRFRLYYRFLIPRIASGALRIITVSEFSKREICSRLKLDESSISVIGCATPDLFRQVSLTLDPVDRRAYVLAVASLEPRKNLAGVIKAFRRLGRPDLRLIVVGEAHRAFTSGDWQALAQGDAQIQFTGYVSDAELAVLYQGATALVFPSLYEGFGLPPLEAMSAGCPCLISNVTALPEVFGDAALYCDPLDVADIASQLERLVVDSSLRSNLIQRGLKLAQSRTWKGAAEALLRIVEEYT